MLKSIMLFSLHQIMNPLRRILFMKSAPKEPAEQIRAELFSIERLEQHAESLAQAQRASVQHSRGAAILDRVKENGRALSAAHRSLTQTIREERIITPAAEWIMDNFHIIEEQILEIIDDLPPEFYAPQLTEASYLNIGDKP